MKKNEKDGSVHEGVFQNCTNVWNGKINWKRESVHPEAVCNDENEVEVEGEIKIRTQRYEDTLTVKTIVKVGPLYQRFSPNKIQPFLLLRGRFRRWTRKV